ncbi:MAG: hypothetical protein K2W96_05665 [Gemmataceae bacterium]|nr:hypothetical protein [Gemmataceae bacterium]
MPERKKDGRAAPTGAAREAMEASTHLWATAGRAAIERRLAEIQRSLGTGRMLQAEEWCALKALRGDFDGIGSMAPEDDRAAISSFESEGGRATEAGEETGCDRRDRSAVTAALAAASHRP